MGLGLQRAAHVVTVQRDVSPEQVLYYQDVLAVSLRLDESQVPPSLLPRGQLDDVRRLWVSGQVGAVLFRDDPPVDYRPYAGSGKRTRVLRDAWIEMITDHPFDYAAERLDLARRLLGIGDAIPGAWYATSDDLDWEGSPELAQHFTNLNDLRGDYLHAFDSGVEGFGGGLHRAWIYLVLGLLSAGLIIALDPRLRVFGATLLALQIALQLVLVFAAPLGEYRFELFQIVLGIVAAVLAAVVAAQRTSGQGRDHTFEVVDEVERAGAGGTSGGGADSEGRAQRSGRSSSGPDRFATVSSAGTSATAVIITPYWKRTSCTSVSTASSIDCVITGIAIQTMPHERRRHHANAAASRNT